MIRGVDMKWLLCGVYFTSIITRAIHGVYAIYQSSWLKIIKKKKLMVET
jgi:hypothetical protein